MMVETGEMFALFGPSGTGKSVLLKTTIGLMRSMGSQSMRVVHLPYWKCVGR